VAKLRQTISNKRIYYSARESMEIHCYIHSARKQTNMKALVDCGATENFINLSYARWLGLPISVAAA